MAKRRLAQLHACKRLFEVPRIQVRPQLPLDIIRPLHSFQWVKLSLLRESKCKPPEAQDYPIGARQTTKSGSSDWIGELLDQIDKIDG